MMKHRAAALALCGLMVCAGGCATPQLQTPGATATDIQKEAETQRRFAFEHARDERLKVLSLGYPLTTAAADLCGENIAGVTGALLWSAHDYTGDDEKVARSDFDIHDGYSILAVMEGSPAAKAGLKPGDRLLNLDGQDLPDAKKAALRIIHDHLKEAYQKNRPIPYDIRRNGVFHHIDVAVLPACNYQANVVRSEAVNAYADGEDMFVTTGLMNFIRSEEELALVMGHELSHNFLGHISAKERNSIIGLGAGVLLDAVVIATTGVNAGLYRRGEAAGALAFSVAFEQEADYAGLYVMRRAGYDIDGVAEFWRRMALDNSRQINTRTDHPASAERFVALEQAVKEIKAKESAREPLVPNLKKH